MKRFHRSVSIDLRRVPPGLFIATFLVACSASALTVSEPGPAFIRIGDDPSVFYLPAGTTTYCLVAEPVQMKVFGGFGQVKQVAAGTTIADRTLDGTCRYPDGPYTVAGTTYVLRGTTICREARPVGRATALPPGALVGVSRRDVGVCHAG